MAQQPEAVTQFFVQSARICDEAQFLIDSIPHAEVASAERLTHQLFAICTILHSLDDLFTSRDTVKQMIDSVNSLLLDLESFIQNPPPPPAAFIGREYTGRPGRPHYQIDLARAKLLHNLCGSWEAVAQSMGVTRPTLYNHLHAAGISTSCPAHTVISDDELDERVAQISLAHPFSGSTIIKGHLESQNIHLPQWRVQESLKCVDAIRVLTW